MRLALRLTSTTSCKWDSVIPFDKLWAQYERIIKYNGAIVLTAAQPFTSALIMSKPELYKYSWVWIKSIVGGVFNAKNRPLKKHEDVLVFSKAPAANVKGEKMSYYPQGVTSIDVVRKNGKRGSDSTIGTRPSRKGEYKQTTTGYPNDILEFASERDLIHPTQKPITLFEYLIKTYTKEGDLVLDSCGGSGTTAVAAYNTNRDYILIESSEEYFHKSSERLVKVKNPGLI